MKVPFNDVQYRRTTPSRPILMGPVQRCGCNQARFILGQEVEAFEAEFADLLAE